MRKSSILLQTASRKVGGGRFARDYLVVGVILLIYLLLALLVFDPRLHTGGDNAHYICLARSILQGKGYKDIYMPGEPPHTQYPFGYPFLLSIVMIPFRGSFLGLKFLSLLLGAGCVLLFYVLMRDRCSSLFLLAVVLLFAVSPLLLEYSHWILSDVSFTFFSLLSLFLFGRAELDKRKFPPLLWASIACMVFTFHIRTIGAALFLGVPFYLGFKKQLRKLSIVLVVIVVLALPWFVRTARLSQGVGYLTQLMLRNPYDFGSGRIGLKDGMLRLRANSERYFMVAVPKTVLSVHNRLWPVPKRRWDVYSFGLLVSAIVLLGFAGNFRRRIRFSEYYIIFYMGTLLIWPQVWATDRFLLPIAPFVLFYFLEGGLLLSRKLDASSRKKLGLIVTVLLLFSSVITVGKIAPYNIRIMRAYARGNKTAGYPREWINYYEAAAYASRFTAQNDAFMARKPALFYLSAKRKCLAYPFTFDQEEIMRTIKENRISFVIVDAFTWTQTTRRYLVPAILAHESDFQVVYATQAPGTVVLRYTGE